MVTDTIRVFKTSRGLGLGTGLALVCSVQLHGHRYIFVTFRVTSVMKHEHLAYSNETYVHDAKIPFKKAIEMDCHGKLFAEHGHWTEYHAPVESMQRLKHMDPCNKIVQISICTKIN